MSSLLHRTLSAHQPHPRTILWSSVLLTMLFVGLHWILWVLAVTTSRSLAETIYALPGVIRVSQVAALLLIAYVGLDAWRRRTDAGAVAVILIWAVCALLLGALLVFLTMVHGLAVA